MIQNAGIFEFDAYTETEDGYERAFQINCFSHFIFGNRLLEKMELAGTERCKQLFLHFIAQVQREN